MCKAYKLVFTASCCKGGIRIAEVDSNIYFFLKYSNLRDLVKQRCLFH